MENSEGLYNSDDSNQFSDDDDGGFSLRNAVVDELSSDFKKTLKIDNYVNKKRNIYYEEEEEDDEDITETLMNQMGYGKTGRPKHEPPATPIPAENLKSAMKDSSKKEELLHTERKVTWAEDVYDPTPSAASHFTTNRIERHTSDNKKSGKNRQKWGGKAAGGGAKGGKDKGKEKEKGSKDKEKKQGGGAKGGKYKDKKQGKKYSGSSTRKCLYTLDEDDTLD